MEQYDEDFLRILNDNDQLHLCVMDTEMKKILKTILKDDETLFSYPGCIGTSADKSTIYILDYFKGCYGISLDGRVRFHYSNPEVECYFGLVVHNDGLLIGSGNNDNCQVEKVSFRDDREEVCTDFGKSSPLVMVNNELAIFSADDNKSHFIRFYSIFKKWRTQTDNAM